MKIKLVESSGKVYSTIQNKVEDSLAKLEDIGITFNFYRTIQKNKYQSYYFGTYKGKSITLTVNTTSYGIDDPSMDIFLSLELNGEVTDLGAANSSDPLSIRELFNLYFKDKEESLLAQERKDQELKKSADAYKRQQDEEATALANAKEKEINDQLSASRKELSKRYKEITGKTLSTKTTSEQAELELNKYKVISDFDKALDLLGKTGVLLQLSLNNGDELKVIKIKRLAYNQYLSDNKVYSKESIKSEVEGLLKDKDFKPNLLAVYNYKDEIISTEYYG